MEREVIAGVSLVFLGTCSFRLVFIFWGNFEFVFKNAQAHPWGARPRAPALGRFENKFKISPENKHEAALYCAWGGGRRGLRLLLLGVLKVKSKFPQGINTRLHSTVLGVGEGWFVLRF
jgi:hypothetical protein